MSSGRESSYGGQQQGMPITLFYSGTDTPLGGQPVCYDWQNSTVARRSTYVTRPTLNNIRHFAGFIVAGSFKPNDDSTGGWVDVVPPTSSKLAGVKVYTDENCAVGDLLAPLPGINHFGRAVAHPPCCVVIEAADRSVTPGLVTVEYFQQTWADADPSKLYRDVETFRYPNIPGVVAGALASHRYFLKGTTAIVNQATNGSTPAGTGIGELSILGTTTTEAQIQEIGAQYLLSAGRSIFLRQRVKIDDISDEDWFFGLAPPPTVSGGVLTGVSAIASGGTTPNGTDYIGAYLDGSGFAGVPKINIRKASGTEQAATLTTALVNDTYMDIAILARNRLAGVTAGCKTVYVWVNGTLVQSLTTAAVAAAFPDTVPLSWAMAGITGACLGTINRKEIGYHM